jgi:hypothetical protein
VPNNRAVRAIMLIVAVVVILGLLLGTVRFAI